LSRNEAINLEIKLANLEIELPNPEKENGVFLDFLGEVRAVLGLEWFWMKETGRR